MRYGVPKRYGGPSLMRYGVYEEVRRSVILRCGVLRRYGGPAVYKVRDSLVMRMYEI